MEGSWGFSAFLHFTFYHLFCQIYPIFPEEYHCVLPCQLAHVTRQLTLTHPIQAFSSETMFQLFILLAHNTFKHTPLTFIHLTCMHLHWQFKVRQRRLDRSKILFYIFSLCTIPWYSYLVELSTRYVNPKTMEATLQCYFVMSIFFSANYWSHIKHFIVHTSVYCARHIFSHVHWCIEPQLFSALCQKVFKSHIRMRMFTNPRLELATHNHQ